MALNEEFENIREYLLRKNLATDNQIKEAQLQQEILFKNELKSGKLNGEKKRVEHFLVEKKIISNKHIAEAISDIYKLPLFSMERFKETDIDMKIATLISENFARELNCILLHKTTDNKLFIVSKTPYDIKIKVRLKNILRTDISRMTLNVISSEDFDILFTKIYKYNLSINKIQKEHRETELILSSDNINTKKEGDMQSIIDSILSEAIADGVSDIHIEPILDKIIIRFRKDTIPIIAKELPIELESMLLGAINVLCELPLDKKSIPLDGRFERTYNGKKFDFRINVLPLYLPTRTTSKVAIRVLAGDKIPAAIHEVGFTNQTLETYERMIKEPHGLILVVGPTGSGKTTTLYSTIRHLDPLNKIIVTLEDPPEFSVEYVNQCKVTSEAGDNPNAFTYRAGLKAILRQDADVILVGEIRDTEVAELAIQSAEVGRLVLSTLHVDNAIATVLRLTNLGIKPYLIASVLVGVASQRLVRRICPHCKEAYTPNKEDVGMASALLRKDLRNVTFYKGRGCTNCNNTGYKAVIPTYEILNFKEITPLKELVAKGELSSEILTKLAMQHGYKPMVFDGYEKVILGQTTFDEINRVVLDANQRKIIEDFLKDKI